MQCSFALGALHAGWELEDMAYTRGPVGINERHVGSTIKVGLKEQTNCIGVLLNQGKIEAVYIC